jgi:uncharacterized membrane protein
MNLRGVVMRGTGLIIAGSILAGCSDPSVNAPADANAEEQRQNAASNEAASADPAAPQPQSTDTANSGQAAHASPCLMQGADRLQIAPIRAVGTEPFWGARVEGRCVTYSTPENQQGVRVWARYAEGGGGRAAWIGQLDGKPFEMRVRPEAGCSDGMSDERYPLAVELTVHGEQRRGCAKPL